MQFFPPHLLAQHAVSTVHKPILAERFKTKMCQNYEREGFCPYEARCMFAHGEHELRTKEMNYRDNLVTEEAIKEFLAIRTSPAVAAHYDGRSILAERFKTKLCQNYERAGECTFEHRCMFAHGEDDLRTKEMNIEDGLLTEEAIKDFQNSQAAAARDADRRRKRNQKKKAKLQAAKEARKQLQPATVADAAEPRSADGSGSEGGPQLAPCTLREEPRVCSPAFHSRSVRRRQAAVDELRHFLQRRLLHGLSLAPHAASPPQPVRSGCHRCCGGLPLAFG
jgi:hypothetical protein